MEGNQRILAAKQFAKNKVKSVSNYFKPAEKVRVRDFVREVPGAVAQTFSGTRDTVVKGGKILGEGLAYATSKNVRDQYKAGNTNILPTVSNTTPRQMLANTAKSAFEIAPVGKIKGLATAAMSAKLLPRVLAGGAMGYGYDMADKMSRPEPVSQSTFHPGIATLAGALFGGMSRPTSEMLGQAGREIGDDIRNINPANRLSHKVVDKYDYEPVPGVFAPGGIQQQRPIMESFRKEVETTQLPYSPQSSIARFLMGKQKVGMGIEPQNPLLQEARKYKVYRTELPDRGDIHMSGNVGTEGKFYFTEQGMADATKYGKIDGLKSSELELKNPFVYDGLQKGETVSVSLAKRWLPDTYKKILDEKGIRGVDEAMAKEAGRRGYDAIIYGDQEIQVVPDLYNKAQGTNKK